MSKSLTGLAAVAAIMASGLGLPMEPPRPQREQQLFTRADEERLAKAEAKRQRRAAKRLKSTPTT